MPLIACSFNFYVERSIKHNAKEVGNKTSSVLKSLVMSKTVDNDTGNTIDDIMSQTKNNTIISVTNGKNLNNWGVNGKIDISGFDRDQFFVASGAGTLTKEVNNKKSILQLNPLSFSKINISWEKVKHFRSTDYEKIIY